MPTAPSETRPRRRGPGRGRPPAVCGSHLHEIDLHHVPAGTFTISSRSGRAPPVPFRAALCLSLRFAKGPSSRALRSRASGSSRARAGDPARARPLRAPLHRSQADGATATSRPSVLSASQPDRLLADRSSRSPSGPAGVFGERLGNPGLGSGSAFGSGSGRCARWRACSRASGSLTLGGILPPGRR